MPDQSRELPGQPSLRYLKVEAKRRLSAGEFPTLHDAQLAIAREHGLPSWAALKEHIASGAGRGRPGPGPGPMGDLPVRGGGDPGVAGPRRQ